LRLNGDHAIARRKISLASVIFGNDLQFGIRRELDLRIAEGAYFRNAQEYSAKKI
jgi:hypothetical protein